MTPELFLAAVAGGIWLLLSALYPRHAVWFVMLWVPVQGWFQLNVFDDSNTTVLLYEYQLVAIYVIFLVRAVRFPKQFAPPRVLLFALPFVLWVIVLIPNSLNQAGPILTIIGLRTYLFPLPLVWVGYRTFRSQRELELFGSAWLMEAGVIGVIAALQFASLVTAWGAVVAVPTGYNAAGTLRPPGTFSSPGHLGMYVLAVVPLAIGYLGLSSTWRRTIYYSLGLAGAALALVVNSQRATVVSLIVSLPLIALLSKRADTTKTLGIALGIVAVGVAVGSWIVRDAFYDRVRSIADDATYTLQIAPLERMSEALQTPLVGGGLGTASPGTGRVNSDFINAAESFCAAIVFEMGIPGLMLFVVMVLALMTEGYRALLSCRMRDTGLLAAAILIYEVMICLNSWSYDPLHYPPSRVLFWFWAGVLLSLPQLSSGTLSARAVTADRVGMSGMVVRARRPIVHAPRVVS